MDIVIVGAGGHGKVVLDAVGAEGKHLPVGFIDADASLAGTKVGGVAVLGSTNILPRLRQRRVAGAIVAVGDNRARRRYAAILAEQGYELISVIHPAATVSPSATLGTNIVVCAGAIICAEARIEDSVIVNTGAIVEHECVIGEAAHICPAAALAGRVRVGEGAFVGLGSRIIQCVAVGEYSVVGAGATVLCDVPAFSTVVGVPARIIKMEPFAEMEPAAS